MRRLWLGFLSVHLILLSATGGTNGLPLGEMGAWEIIVAADAIPAEQYAAEEFCDHLEKASGVRVPIRGRVKNAEGQIFIGPGDAMRASPAGFDTRAFASEDLRYVVGDKVIVIAGGRPRGTLYGVYQFLEDVLGVRFLTADHTHVPPFDPQRALAPVDRFYHPPLAFRRSYYAEAEAHESFAARLRNHSDGMRAERYGGRPPLTLINHSFGRLLPVGDYGRRHPEYYAMVDGARRSRVDDDWGSEGTQPCLTNPDVLRVVSAGVLRELRDKPWSGNVSVSQNDNPYYCRCGVCAALDEQEGSPMGSLLAFVNAVAGRVSERHPGVWVGTLAYDYSQPPPRGIKPAPNVQIQLCSSDSCILHPMGSPACPRNAAFATTFGEWSQLCDKLTIWSYNVNFYDYLLPCPNLRAIEPHVRALVAGGARGIMLQGAYNGMGAEFAGLRHYLSSRLLWDPTLSGEALTEEFLTLHYGRAAPPIRRFVNFLHDHAAQAGVHHGYAGGAADYGIDAAVVRAGLDAFAEALVLAADDAAVRARVELASVCAYRAALEPVWDRRLPVLLDHELRDAMRPLAERFFALCKAHGVTMASERMSMGEARRRIGFVLGVAEDKLGD